MYCEVYGGYLVRIESETEQYFVAQHVRSVLGEIVFHPFVFHLIISQTTNITLSKTKKKFVEDNFKFDENGRKFSKRVENTLGKGEIARYEQFLLFPQCF